MVRTKLSHLFFLSRYAWSWSLSSSSLSLTTPLRIPSLRKRQELALIPRYPCAPFILFRFNFFLNVPFSLGPLCSSMRIIYILYVFSYTPYTESSSQSSGQRLGGALLNAVIIISIVVAMTMLLVVFFFYRWKRVMHRKIPLLIHAYLHMLAYIYIYVCMYDERLGQ